MAKWWHIALDIRVVQITCCLHGTKPLPEQILTSQIAKSMGPTWGPPGSCRPEMGPMLAPWTLLSGLPLTIGPLGTYSNENYKFQGNFANVVGKVASILFKLQRHQMETFSALLAICAGNSPVPGEFPAQRPVTRSFDVFFDLRLNKRLSKQSWGWWFETLSRSLWRHRNEKHILHRNGKVVTMTSLIVFNVSGDERDTHPDVSV